MSVSFDTKIAIVLRDDLETWQKLNVTAFISSALVGAQPDLVGEVYRDGSGREYLSMVVQPMMIYQADAAAIRKAYQRALDREVDLAIFTRELFATSNDADNRAAVAATASDDLDLVGVAMRDTKKTVDKVVKGLKLHA